MKNSNLHQARKAKNDEFYTALIDIEKELIHYTEQLYNKIIYCPFDDYRMSNFVKYFKDNFTELKLKKLITTNYNIGSGAYKYEYDGVNETITKLEGNGDFESDECTKIKNECDIIISNPPFSKFRSVFKWIIDNGNKFLIMGNMNAIKYREVFPLIKNNKIWTGYNFSTNCTFQTPLYYEKYYKIVDGVKYTNVGSITWFTNLQHNKSILTLSLHKNYNRIDYKKYDNYNAINVDKSVDIPLDYNDLIGVPISILKYLHYDGKIHFYSCGEHYTFEIIDALNQYSVLTGSTPETKGKFLTDVGGKHKFTRIIIRRTKEL